MMRGRTFTPSDTQDAPLVVVINNAMARAYWGDRIRSDNGSVLAGRRWRTVVGVVGDVRHEGLDVKPAAGDVSADRAGARTSKRRRPSSCAPRSMPAAMTVDPARGGSAIGSSVPMDRVRTMEQLVAASVGQPRFRTFLLAALSLLALVMASIGIYGVTNYIVVQRTREIRHLA